MAALPPKQRPGRPRLSPKPPPLPIGGVAAAPRDADKLVELELDATKDFKRVFGMFKAMDAPEIQLVFDPTGVSLYAMPYSAQALRARDTLARGTRIFVRIDGARANHYFCGAPVVQCAISRTKFDRVFAAPNANTHCVKLHMLRGEPELLFVTYVNAVLDRLCEYSLTLTQFDDELVGALAGDAALVFDEAALVARYPFEWQLEGSDFKQMVVENVNFAATVDVMKAGDGPLTLKYRIANGHDYCETYATAAKIKLRVAPGAARLFHVSLNLQQLVPLASSACMLRVRLLHAPDRPTVFCSLPPAKKGGRDVTSAAAFRVAVVAEDGWPAAPV